VLLLRRDAQIVGWFFYIVYVDFVGCIVELFYRENFGQFPKRRSNSNNIRIESEESLKRS